MLNFKNIFSKASAVEEDETMFVDNTETEDFSIDLSYTKVPLTLALRKRKYEEEQYSKYGIAKEKICEIH